jgi:hypothetical protein
MCESAIIPMMISVKLSTFIFILSKVIQIKFIFAFCNYGSADIP